MIQHSPEIVRTLRKARQLLIMLNGFKIGHDYEGEHRCHEQEDCDNTGMCAACQREASIELDGKVIWG
jgi:hypothetical protein